MHSSRERDGVSKLGCCLGYPQHNRCTLVHALLHFSRVMRRAASCLQCLMRWVCKTYTLWLLRVRSGAEDAVFSIGSALAPFGVRLLER